MIDKELFEEIEKSLYKHFEQLKIIEKLKNKIELLEKQKIQIIDEKVELKKFNPELGTNMGIDYSVERVQSSADGSSEAEKNIIRYIDELEKQYNTRVCEILKIKAEIREIEMKTYNIEYNLNTLNEEEKRFIEWKYGEEKSIEWIANEMYGGARTTAYRKREEVINEIYKSRN